MRFAAGILWAIALSLPLVPAPGRAGEPVVLQLRWDHQFQFAGYYAALWTGQYEAAGLDVEIRPRFTPDGDKIRVLDYLAAGTADFAVTGADALIAVDQGAPLVLVASLFQRSPVEVFIRPGLDVASPADLVGRRVLMRDDPVIDAEVIAMLQGEGLSLDSVQVVPVAPGQTPADFIAALRSGAIDAYPSYSLSVGWAMHRTGDRFGSLRPSAYGTEFYGDSLFTRRDLADRRPELVEAFRDASLRGWTYALENPGEIAEAIATRLTRTLPLDDPRAYNEFLAEKVRALTLHPVVELGHVNAARWRRMHESLQTAGLVRWPFDAAGFFFDPDRGRRQWRQGALVVGGGGLLVVLAAFAAVAVWNRALQIRVERQAMTLTENERLFRTIFDSTNAGIVIGRADGAIVDANAGLQQITGYSRDELRALGWEGITHPDDRRKGRVAIEAMLRGEAPRQRFENRCVRKDGKIAWIDLSITLLGRDGSGPMIVAVVQDITPRMLQEIKARQINDELTLILESAGEGIFGVDVAGRITFVNPAAARMFGHDRDGLLGRSRHDTIHHSHADGRPYAAEDCPTVDVLRRGVARKVEGEVFWHRDGTPFPVDYVSAPAVEDGRVVGAVVVFRDMSEARRAERLLRDAVESLNDGFALYDADDRLVLFNAKYREIYEASAAVIAIGNRFEDVVRHGVEHGQYAGAVGREDAFVRERLALHRDPHGPIEQRLADGRWLRIVERKTADGGIVGIRSDITALKQAQQRLVDAIEAIPDGFALWDADDRLVLCNRNHRRIFDKLSGMLTPGAAFEDILRAGVSLGQYAANGTSAEETVRRRLERHRRGESTFEQELYDGRWLLRSERRTAEGGIVAVSTDITKLILTQKDLAERQLQLSTYTEQLQANARQLEAAATELEQERDRANAANLAKSQFLATMSHELRTPLNAVIGFSDILRAEMFGPIGNGKYREYAENIHDSGRMLLALINDILDMSRIEAGKYQLRPEPVAMSDVVATALLKVVGRAEDAGLRLENAVPDGLPILEADPRVVQQVLLNLLTNAVKFTPRGGSVRVGAEARGDWFDVWVHDDGIGIAAEDLPSIFEPFVQIERQRHGHVQEGTGLGLSLCKRLVDLHGGMIVVDSALGVGTTVTVTLPIGRPGPRAEDEAADG